MAVQVRIITCPDAQPLMAASVVSVKVTSTLVSQLSVAVTVGIDLVPVSPQAASISLGIPTSTGGVLSSTAMSCTCSVLLPQASTALQVLTSV